jgi:hypothetical protein
MGEHASPITIATSFLSHDGKCAVVIDDDGRVGYAYLRDSTGKICGDVWLYNRGWAPKEPEWIDPDKAPYANPEAYVDLSANVLLPASPDDFSVEWGPDASSCEAWIFIRQTLVAVLARGTKPGWSRLAKKDGPLAKVLKQ